MLKKIGLQSFYLKRYTGWFTEITMTTKEYTVSNSIFSGPPCILESLKRIKI